MFNKNNYLECAELLSFMFDYKMEITDKFHSNVPSYGEYTMSKRPFHPIENEIRINPCVINSYEEFIATYFHELGHLLDYNLHGVPDGDDYAEDELVASYVSMFLTSYFYGNVSFHILRQIVTTTSIYGYNRELEDVVKHRALDCISYFAQRIMPDCLMTVEFFIDLVTLHKGILREAYKTKDLNGGNFDESIRRVVKSL